MNPIILPSCYEQIVGQTKLLALFKKPVYEKENSEFKPVKLR